MSNFTISTHRSYHRLCCYPWSHIFDSCRKPFAARFVIYNELICRRRTHLPAIHQNDAELLKAHAGHVNNVESNVTYKSPHAVDALQQRQGIAAMIRFYCDGNGDLSGVHPLSSHRYQTGFRWQSMNAELSITSRGDYGHCFQRHMSRVRPL